MTNTKFTVNCPTDQWSQNGEVWLEYGWVKDENDYHDMLWYNEGRSEEFNTWFRALMTKYRANEPSGTMYFKMLLRPDCNIEIICEDTENNS